MTATAASRAMRGIRADEVSGVVERVEAWLDVPGQLVGSYPQVFGRGRRAELFGVFEGETLCSHAACQAVTVRTAQGPVRVVMVGSVATAPEQRGRGLASDLLRQLAQLARDGDHDAMVLWSDRWDFYQRLGFRPSGQQLEVELNRTPTGPVAGVRAADFGDLWAMLQLHEDKACAVVRTAGELAVLLSAAPMTTVVLERNGEVRAYACCGKGIDFGGWWHEVGGADNDVAELIASAMATLGQERATLMLPNDRRGVVERLGGVVEVREGVSGLCLPLSARGRTPPFIDGLDSI